jgi:hypothetical protein
VWKTSGELHSFLVGSPFIILEERQAWWHRAHFFQSGAKVKSTTKECCMLHKKMAGGVLDGGNDG